MDRYQTVTCKTPVIWRLARLEKRLDFGCATRNTTPQAPCTELHGRYRTPKQLARNAKNPGKTRVLQRRGQEPNNLQIPWETHTSTPRATRNTTRADFIVCDDSKHYPSRPTCNCFTARFTGSRIQDRSKFTGSWFSVCRVIYRVTSKTPENLQGHDFGLQGQANNDTDRFQFGSSTGPPPATGGFQMNSGQRESHGHRLGMSETSSTGTPTDKTGPRLRNSRLVPRVPSPHRGH